MKHLEGQRFGRLIALRDSGRRKNEGCVEWECKCICGNIVYVKASSLVSGNTKSCGCLQFESVKSLSIKNYKHGKKPKRLYHIWEAMKARCYNPNKPKYKYYGGRGIRICREWVHDFIPFRNWAVANGYQDNLTIDRIDNSGNYEPSNCQWLTRSENTKKAWQLKKANVDADTDLITIAKRIEKFIKDGD